MRDCTQKFFDTFFSRRRRHERSRNPQLDDFNTASKINKIFASCSGTCEQAWWIESESLVRHQSISNCFGLTRGTDDAEMYRAWISRLFSHGKAITSVVNQGKAIYQNCIQKRLPSHQSLASAPHRLRLMFCRPEKWQTEVSKNAIIPVARSRENKTIPIDFMGMTFRAMHKLFLLKRRLSRDQSVKILRLRFRSNVMGK